MSEKFCIFCGKKPEKKNLEHVIPQWLIKMTGHEKSDVFEDYPADHKHIPFIQYKFPACTECNTKYAKLEADVKPILERVLDGQSIYGIEASVLMDWFDKLRTGLWLTHMYYDPQLKREVNPNFFIDSRVAKTDRMLSIQKIKTDKPGAKGVLWNGTNTVLFNHCPSAFTMIINDYYFFNASENQLVSPRVGFQQIVDVKVKDETKGILEGKVMPGNHKVVNPIIQTFIPHKDSITFYQPIYRDYLQHPIFKADDYILEHSYASMIGLGGVFVQKGNTNNIRYLYPEDKVGIKLHPIQKPDVPYDVLNFQKAIHGKTIVSSPEMLLGAKLNSFFLEQMKKQK